MFHGGGGIFSPAPPTGVGSYFGGRRGHDGGGDEGGPSPHHQPGVAGGGDFLFGGFGDLRLGSPAGGGGGILHPTSFTQWLQQQQHAQVNKNTPKIPPLFFKILITLYFAYFEAVKSLSKRNCDIFLFFEFNGKTCSYGAIIGKSRNLKNIESKNIA